MSFSSYDDDDDEEYEIISPPTPPALKQYIPPLRATSTTNFGFVPAQNRLTPSTTKTQLQASTPFQASRRESQPELRQRSVPVSKPTSFLTTTTQLKTTPFQTSRRESQPELRQRNVPVLKNAQQNTFTGGRPRQTNRERDGNTVAAVANTNDKVNAVAALMKTLRILDKQEANGHHQNVAESKTNEGDDDSEDDSSEEEDDRDIDVIALEALGLDPSRGACSKFYRDNGKYVCFGCRQDQGSLKELRTHLKYHKGCNAGDRIGCNLDILGQDLARRYKVPLVTRTNKLIKRGDKEKYQLSFAGIDVLSPQLEPFEKRNVAQIRLDLAKLHRL